MLGLATAALSAALLQEQHVSARAYGCDFSGAKSVAILVQNHTLFGDDGREVAVPATLSSGKALEFEFTLPPGAFSIDYFVPGLRCDNGGGGITILPGHNRRIFVQMIQGSGDVIAHITDWHNRKFFSGTLPAGVSVSVVASQDSDCPGETAPEYAATIDGDAYYVEYVHGRHTFLKLRNAFKTLYLALPDASSPDLDDQYVVRNITNDDLRLLATHEPSVQCVREPSGSSSPFSSSQGPPALQRVHTRRPLADFLKTREHAWRAGRSWVLSAAHY